MDITNFPDGFDQLGEIAKLVELVLGTRSIIRKRNHASTRQRLGFILDNWRCIIRSEK